MSERDDEEQRPTPGRHCPLHYRYSPDALAMCQPLAAQTLYVVGGLYGNTPALDAIDGLIAREVGGSVRVIFNGDFHWFDIDPGEFASVHSRVLRFTAIKGNVEAELGDPGPAGCGCNYPESTDEATVQWSNRIMHRLSRVAADFPAFTRHLASLPRFLTARVGDLRVGIVHGDLHSLAGWDLDQASLPAHAETPAGQRLIRDIRRASVDLVASTHTCLPCAQDYSIGGRQFAVINNGSAGMPNFRGDARGLITRLSIHPSPSEPLYGMRLAGVHVDAVPVAYDQAEWHTRFHSQWPPGSPARESYGDRIACGPDYSIGQAARGGFAVS